MGWHSLWVVLYDLTVQEFKNTVKSVDSRSSLLSLGGDVTVFEWNSASPKYETWPYLYNIIKSEILYQDEECGAIQKWYEFLREWPNVAGSFPRASTLYRPASHVSSSADSDDDAMSV